MGGGECWGKHYEICGITFEEFSLVFVGWTGIVLSSCCTSEFFVASEESLLVEEKYCVLAFYLTR